MMEEYLAKHPAFQPPKGVIVAHIPLESPTASFRSRPVRNALAAAGLTPKQAEHLLIDFPMLPLVDIYDEYTPRPERRKTEHVVARMAHTASYPITVLEVAYHPAAANYSKTVDSVMTENAEILLGLRGLGYLQVVPVREFQGRMFPENRETRWLSVTSGTLIIFPPNRHQANRWGDLGSQYENRRPSLIARYLTFPKPYANAARIPLDLTDASHPWDYRFDPRKRKN